MNLTPSERAAYEREARAQAAADRDYGQALWYAWGRLDGDGIGPSARARLDAFKFAERVKAQALTFHRGKSISLQSIQDSWTEYVDETAYPER